MRAYKSKRRLRPTHRYISGYLTSKIPVIAGTGTFVLLPKLTVASGKHSPPATVVCSSEEN